MAQEGKEEVAALLARFPSIISYVPLRDEVDVRAFTSTAPTYEIAPDPDTDPVTVAQSISIRTSPVAVLVPGQRFDASGTRHGRGGGWYDRFLAAVPASWVRIGFCTESQFSETPLLRQSWDQPVDYVAVVGDRTVLHETRARDLVS